MSENSLVSVSLRRFDFEIRQREDDYNDYSLWFPSPYGDSISKLAKQTGVKINGSYLFPSPYGDSISKFFLSMI